MADDNERVHYFDRQFLRLEDFTVEQAYHLRHQRDHTRLLHTPGIAAGLDFQTPSVGATAVTINPGVAFDEQGRRIVLAGVRTLELRDAPSNASVYVTIKHAEATTLHTDETGASGDRRWLEDPLVEWSATVPASPDPRLVLAYVVRAGTTGTTVTEVRTAIPERRTAGVRGGDFAVQTLTFSSGSIAQTGWVTASLSAAQQVKLNGSLNVTGTIQGQFGAGTVGTEALAALAVTAAKIGSGAVTSDKLGTNSVGATQIVDGAISATKLDTAAKSKLDNAFPTSGGTLTGNLQVSANVGINVAPAHRLHVKAGDETDQTTFGAVVDANTGAATTTTVALNGNAESSGSGAVYALNVTARGAGSGKKTGISCYVQGEGEKNAAIFSAATTTTSAMDRTQAVDAHAASDGGGEVLGLAVKADGAGTGRKTGIDCSVSGAAGYKYAGNFTAASTATGWAQALTATATGVGTTGVRGLVVDATGNGSGNTYGIYCSASNSGGGETYAGYFVGNVKVAGIIEKLQSNFLIDHPLDPYRRTLRHGCVESPEDLCLYRGKAALDAEGKALVALPDYFAALTAEEEATVVLTPIGSKPFPLSYEWNDECTAFCVHGDPGAGVSYLVLAARDDPTIRVLRRPVEEDKTAAEAGKLMFPQAYRDSADTGIAPAAAPRSMADAARGAESAAVEPQDAHLAERDRIALDREARDEERGRMRDEHEMLERRRKEKEADSITEVPTAPASDRPPGRQWG